MICPPLCLQAAQAWSTHIGPKDPQPSQQTTPDWWRQVEHLVQESISAASDGLMSSLQHDSVRPPADSNSGGSQLSAAAAPARLISKPLHSTVVCKGQQLPQSPEAQTQDPAALAAYSSLTKFSGQAAHSAEAPPAHDPQATMSDTSPHHTSGFGATAAATMQHYTSGGATLATPHTSTARTEGMLQLPQISVVHNPHDSDLQEADAKLKHSEVAITVLVFPSPTHDGNSSSGGSSNSSSHQLPDSFGTAEALASGSGSTSMRKAWQGLTCRQVAIICSPD